MNYENKYILEKKKLLLKWLKRKIKEGYYLFINIDEMQELIKKLVSWYEFKYPEREIEVTKIAIDEKFKNVKKLNEDMNFLQLLYRLNSKELKLINCEYRANYWSKREIQIDDRKIVNLGTNIFLSISRSDVDKYDITTWKDKTPFITISADALTGELINTYELAEFTDEKNITLEQLHQTLKDNDQLHLNFSQLTECIKNHNIDKKLRVLILQLTALEILLSKNTTISNGYIRAKKFVDEFNNNLNLKINTKEIDEIIDNYFFENNKFKKKNQKNPNKKIITIPIKKLN